MTQVKKGDTVRIHYRGFLEDGTVFDSSTGEAPMEFIIGEHTVIPGLEKAVVGMKVGDTKTVSIPPEHGFGPVREDFKFDLDREKIPPNIEPKLGRHLRIGTVDGRINYATISRITETSVRLDCNHPLAGKNLTYEIHLVDIA